MSTARAESADPPAIEGPLRTVTLPFTGKENAQMNVIGWIVFFGLLVVVIPVLPVIALIWLAAKLTNS
jgi:hypothetical protein